VGTAKRERHKAARQAKLEQLAAEQRKMKRNRKFVRWALVAAGFVALVVVLVSRSAAAATRTRWSWATPPPRSRSLRPPPWRRSLPTEFPYGTTECPPTDGSGERTITFADSFQQCIDPTKTYTAEVETNKGSFTITLDPSRAPGTVNNFVSLARSKYYDGVICHRVVTDFVVQCGDPDGTGRGGPGYTFADELPAEGEYEIGSIAMANAGPDTNGSQFFIITGENGAGLPPSYSLFGTVTAGLDTTVEALAALAGPGDGPPTEEIVMERITITES
jgi:cyclophilin family peptidyl-prolyl cis-trans isomerase